MEYEFKYGYFPGWGQGFLSGPSGSWGVEDVVVKPVDQVPDDQTFPGFLDRGTPLVDEENGKNTIVGIFREYLDQGVSVYDRLYPEIVNWIIDNSDFAVDSSCTTFTSCSCGKQMDGDPSGQGQHSELRSNRIIQGKNLVADDVPSGKYPWEAVVFNAKHDYCADTARAELFKGKDPDGEHFDICSGSLIASKYILTSAACILQNREEIEKHDLTVAKHQLSFTKAPCLYASVGITDWKVAVSGGKILDVKDRYLHDDTFTDITNYNYNLGKFHTWYFWLQ